MNKNHIQKWQELGRKRILDSFAKVDTVRYRLPDGSEKDFDILVQRPAACVVALTEDNMVIMAQQYRPGPDKILMELPGGFIEEGEEPAVGMARELREETGYAGDIQLVTTCLDASGSTMVRSVFVARNCRKVHAQELDEGEFVNVQLVPLEEFKAILRSGEMTDVEVGFLGLDFLELL